MDLRRAREEHLKQTNSVSVRTTRAQTWYEWFWSIPAPIKPQAAEDAAHDSGLRAHFMSMLDFTEPPATFKPSQVVALLSPAELRAMGYDNTDDAIPAVYHLAWELREFGVCEVLRKGQVLGDEVTLEDLDGPVKIRRLAG